MSERTGVAGALGMEALESCLERLMAGDSVDAALSACTDPALQDAVRPLLELASGLVELPEVEGPSPSFRADLAASLASAPQPSSLVQSEQPTPTSQLVKALDVWLTSRQDGAARNPADIDLPDGTGEADELAPLLELAATLGRDGARAGGVSSGFRASLAQQLAEAPDPRALREVRRAPIGVFRHLWRSTAFMAASAATVIMCLGAGVTYASANAVPGELLYPLKRSVEDVRIAVASDSGAMDLRLDFAERRLAEAAGSPDLAGEVLADFSHHVTAALAIVDSSIAAGVPKDSVAAPLVDWLIAARRELIVSQDGLPPMAWRGARALLDEAIIALSGGGVLTGRAVWRLSEPSAILALREVPTHPWAWERTRIRRPIVLEPTAPEPAFDAPVASGVSGALASALVASLPQGADPASGAPPQNSDPDPVVPPTSAPRATARPTTPLPTSTPPPTAPPEPTAVPPTSVPPTVVPPTVVPPTAPPASPTAPPTATPRIALPLPARLTVKCRDEAVESAGSTICVATLPGPGETQWSASFGRIDVPDDETAPEIAIFTDDSGMSGVAKLIVTITVTFTPEKGPLSSGTTQVFIVPRIVGEEG